MSIFLNIKEKICSKQALILKDGEIVIFSYDIGNIFLYQKKELPKLFLNKVMGELMNEKEVNITI